MADKKKKVNIPKDTITPRRPVILKSDREPINDLHKEKHDKEKQPTIILKTREQSTSKDERPVSPKTGMPDIEHTHTPKIAHNENKDKKEKQIPSCRLMTEPIKLLDENLEFNNAALDFLNDANTNYLIVGNLGTQGVGKSMILDLLNQHVPYDSLCSHILNSCEIPNESTYEMNDVTSIESPMENLHIINDEGSGKNAFKFKMQDIEHIERGIHCTRGIDMYVTNDRIILLDCQALWSPSLIEETNTNPVTARSANIVTVDCLQMASYMMAICHVIIAVQDWFVDYNFIRYIQTAEMLKPSLSTPNTTSTVQEGSESTSTGESHPHLLLLHNRCVLEDFLPESVKAVQDLYRKAFQRSNLQLTSGMYMYSDSNQNGLNIDNVCKTYSVDTCGAPINLFLLPEVYSDYDNKDIYRGHPSFDSLAKRLRWLVLGVNRHQITNVPNLTERGWFQYCSKAWEIIRKCTFYMEYERFLP